jgi:hypothetical protein
VSCCLARFIAADWNRTALLYRLTVCHGIFNNTTRKKETNLVNSLSFPAYPPRMDYLSPLPYFVFSWTDYTLILKQSLALSSLILCVGCNLCYLFPGPTSGHLADYRHFLFNILEEKDPSTISDHIQIISIP